MMALLLSLSMALNATLLPDPVVGKATWYGYPGPQKCYDGVPRTCTPYRTKAQGGWHNEVVNYCALPGYRWRSAPFWVKVTNVATGASALCLVRDSCGCVGGGIIDLSPAVFRKLRNLKAGIVKVRIERYVRPVGGHGR